MKLPPMEILSGRLLVAPEGEGWVFGYETEEGEWIRVVTQKQWQSVALYHSFKMALGKAGRGAELVSQIQLDYERSKEERD